MSWTDRQRAMLREMGLTVWSPPPVATPAAAHAVAPLVAPDADTEAAAGTATVRASASSGPSPAAATPTATPTATPAASPPPVAAPRPSPARPATPAVATAAAVPDDERSRHIATLDWPALREAVAGCQACGLCATRTQTVFGVGQTRAHWLIVGEAPGEQEDRQGEPFVGPAGQLLDQMLQALSLSRAGDGPQGPERQVYIANTLKCRPPRNRNPEPAEMLACEPFLMRQIALLQPRIILAMGRFAIQALLRSNDAVGKLRGRVHRYQGVPLVVTYHPAYLLRNLADKARAWDDLCLAADVAEGG